MALKKRRTEKRGKNNRPDTGLSVEVCGVKLRDQSATMALPRESYCVA
jgi:hypothetical protein